MGSCCLPSQLPKLSQHKATPSQKRLNFPLQSFSFFCTRSLDASEAALPKSPPSTVDTGGRFVLN